MRLVPGTRAFVTGASRGIGRALARELAQRGAVVGLSARDEDGLRALAAELPGDGHVVLPCDVADAAAVAASTAAFVEQAGGIDLLVANAGFTHYEPFATAPLEAATRMTQVNWLGTVHTVHAALPTLLQQRAGHIVVVSSGAALRSFPSAAVYGATKAAQKAFGEALFHELSGTGVGLTLVYPGEIATSLHDHEKDRMPAWYHGDQQAAPPEALVAALLEAVQAGKREVAFPPFVKLLGVLNGLHPAAADLFLRRLRGAPAAPRRRN